MGKGCLLGRISSLEQTDLMICIHWMNAKTSAEKKKLLESITFSSQNR